MKSVKDRNGKEIEDECSDLTAWNNFETSQRSFTFVLGMLLSSAKTTKSTSKEAGFKAALFDQSLWSIRHKSEGSRANQSACKLPRVVARACWQLYTR